MYALRQIPTAESRRAATLTPGIVVRALFALAALCFMTVQVLAENNGQRLPPPRRTSRHAATS